MYRCTIILLYVLVQYEHVHYFTAVCVVALRTGLLFYCIRCQYDVHNVIIVLHSVRGRYLQGHYGTAVCVSAGYTGLFTANFVSAFCRVSLLLLQSFSVLYTHDH